MFTFDWISIDHFQLKNNLNLNCVGYFQDITMAMGPFTLTERCVRWGMRPDWLDTILLPWILRSWVTFKTAMTLTTVTRPSTHCVEPYRNTLVRLGMRVIYLLGTLGFHVEITSLRLHHSYTCSMCSGQKGLKNQVSSISHLIRSIGSQSED